ncbi:MAG: tRNA (N(6)-L-threonylcarbamoyladenosine(37)-C(2))-methylthiotransferase MtaB [Bacteroidota bacterium]
MSKVAFHTLGCKLNFSESSYISKNLAENNYKIVQFDKFADAYVINTCSVTENADNKFKYFVKQALKVNPNAFIAAIGCYAQLKPKELLNVEGVDLVLGASDKFNLIDYLNNLDKDYSNEVHSCNINEVNTFKESYSLDQRTRAFLKVQDGCDYKCSFCTIPLARGKSRSNSISKVIDNIKKINSENIKEIVLTGINLGDFGKNDDDDNRYNFLDLIKQIEKLDITTRFRISSIEPNLLTDEIIEFISNSKKFVHHFHIPLQSGCDSILRLMRRRYDTDLYKSRIKKIKETMPDASIGVDIIVGFPGEDDEKFLESFNFLERLDVSYLHVFTYSERDNTHAITLPQSVEPFKRSKRSKLLRLLSSRKKLEFYQTHVGSYHNILFESENKNGYIEGLSENYIRYRRKWDSNLSGSIVKSKIVSIDQDGYAI